MTRAASGGRLCLAALTIAACAFAQAAGEGNAFMPKGGRSLVLDLLGPSYDAAQLREITQARRSEPQWREFIATRKSTLTQREQATLAAYLAVNMPIAGDALKRDKPALDLPQDGRELAGERCESCHSLFAGYLTQERDMQGWRNIFISPYHSELKMSPQELEEFARYSVLNMPMKIEDVPPDMRF